MIIGEGKREEGQEIRGVSEMWKWDGVVLLYINASYLHKTSKIIKDRYTSATRRVSSHATC